MYRRVVSLLMVPLVLLTQSVALGHSHGGTQPTGHDARPHLHTNPAPARHTHEHGHHHSGTGGHHHHDLDEVPSDSPTPLPTLPSEPPPDHDSDAIYVGVADAVAFGRSELTDEAGSSPWWSVSDAGVFAKDWADHPAHSVFVGHPPPLRGHICPLYIWHLALLI